MSNDNGRASSAHSTASTLRPRTKRLISGIDEGDEEAFDPANARTRRIASPVPSPYDSRSRSPIPSSRPQGYSPNAKRGNGLLSTAPPSRAVSGRQKGYGAEAPTLAGLWGTTRSAIQGIATELLRNDTSGSENTRQRRPLGRLSTPRFSTSAPPSQWGPSAPTSHPQPGDIGAGTREEQTAAFRARRRKDMLTGQETSYADALGKFKRRLSDDRNSASAPPGENEDREALVYLHPVRRHDTLAGITIKYNISADALRKANRMWPNDSVQMRQTLILPVDACGVKGKPVSGLQEAIDLLGSESEALSTLQAEEVPTPTVANPLPNGFTSPSGRGRTNSASTHTSASGVVSSTESDVPWVHDSWVLLPGNDKPTEIGRLPRRALGYFPPARRKSNCYSDLDTPSPSLDLARTSTSDRSSTDIAKSPLRQTAPRPRHVRRASNATNGYFPSYLSGPGGVGTMSRNVHFPGPAQDGLNKAFAKHLPDVAPPRNQHNLYQPDMPFYSDNPTPLGSGTGTPAFPHSSGGNVNLENLGGAIESWVRRLATRSVHTPQDSQQAARVSVGTPSKGAGGVGDLIEMTDEFEIGIDEEDELEDRGRPLPSAGPSSTATSYFDGGVARGRGSNGAKGKSGKAD